MCFDHLRPAPQLFHTLLHFATFPASILLLFFHSESRLWCLIFLSGEPVLESGPPTRVHIIRQNLLSSLGIYQMAISLSYWWDFMPIFFTPYCFVWLQLAQVLFMVLQLLWVQIYCESTVPRSQQVLEVIYNIWFLESFLSVFCKDPEPWDEGDNISVWFRTENSVVSYSQHVDQ